MNPARQQRDNAPARFVWRLARLDAFPAKRPPEPAWRPWHRRSAASTPAQPAHPARNRISRVPRRLQFAARHCPGNAAAATATGARRAGLREIWCRSPRRNLWWSLGRDSCFLSSVLGGGVYVRRPQSNVFVAPGNPADDSHYFADATVTVLQPDMVPDSMHAWMAFGLAVMFLAQARPEFTSLLVPATVLI